MVDGGFAVHARASLDPSSLSLSKGLGDVRIGVIRESMVYSPDSKSEEPIVTAAVREINEVLGAMLVESSDPLWTPDPNIEQMQTGFRRALAVLVPVFMPDLLFRLNADGQPVFREFAEAVIPTEFAPG